MGSSLADLGPPDLAQAFRSDKTLLFGLSYRLTGSVDDAQEIVQETFARAIERPPARTDRPWRPWLVRVAVNLSLDALRRRRRQRYAGPWLPAPFEGSDVGDSLGAVANLDGSDRAAFDARPDESPEGRYETAESATFAFLLALEALTPRQRAVLILRDVFEYSASETAQTLETSEGNVRVVLHRARRAMRSYDRCRCRPVRELQDRTRRMLEEFMRCLIEQDVEALTKLLADDVRTVTDSGGEYTALPRPLAGRSSVMSLYLRVAKRRAPGARFGIRLVNGLPALTIEFAHTVRRQAPWALLRCELDHEGRIRELHAILGSAKLAALHRANRLEP